MKDENYPELDIDVKVETYFGEGVIIEISDKVYTVEYKSGKKQRFAPHQLKVVS
jgi:glutamine cyclotransferase